MKRINLKNRITVSGVVSIIAVFFLFIAITTSIISFTKLSTIEQQQKSNAEMIAAYFDKARTFERQIIDAVPIYEDWATTAKEQQLRKYLLADHLSVVQSMKLNPIADQHELDERINRGEIIRLDQDKNTPYYFYNVPNDRRFLLPMAAKGIGLITDRLNRRIGNENAIVKLAISSAIRTVAYQGDLRNRNANASLVSSHSYGISFDIFYDSFFVSVKGISNTDDADMSRSLETLRVRTGYLLGDALRRQLHSLLAETLIELQNEGKLYAILEKNQRCYHVTIRPQ